MTWSASLNLRFGYIAQGTRASIYSIYIVGYRRSRLMWLQTLKIVGYRRSRLRQFVNVDLTENMISRACFCCPKCLFFIRLCMPHLILTAIHSQASFIHLMISMNRLERKPFTTAINLPRLPICPLRIPTILHKTQSRCPLLVEMGRRSAKIAGRKVRP